MAIITKTFEKQLRAISRPLNLKILKKIEQNQPIRVKDIYKSIPGMEQSVCSIRLSELKKTKLVTFYKEGKSRYYSINALEVVKLTEQINHFFASKL